MEATHTFPGHSHHIRNARVPILTGKVITGQPVDLSYQPEGETDLAGAGVQLMRDLLDELPQIKPLLLIVKAILKQHELNKARPLPLRSLARSRLRCCEPGTKGRTGRYAAQRAWRV